MAEKNIDEWTSPHERLTIAQAKVAEAKALAWQMISAFLMIALLAAIFGGFVVLAKWVL